MWAAQHHRGDSEAVLELLGDRNANLVLWNFLQYYPTKVIDNFSVEWTFL